MPKKFKNNNNEEPKKFDIGSLKYLGLVGQIGMVIALPLVLMIFLAQWIMNNYINSVWVLILLVLTGLYGGFRNAYFLLMGKR